MSVAILWVNKMLKQAPNFSMDGNEKSHCINIYYIVIKKDITHFSDQTNILQIDEEKPEIYQKCFVSIF